MNRCPSLLFSVTILALPALAEDLQTAAFQAEELRLVARKLVMDNTELQCRLQELENMTKQLVEQRAISRTESELVERHARDVQQRAEASGLPLLTADEEKLQRHLMESVRALRHAEEVQQNLIAQNERLIGLLEELSKAVPPPTAPLQAALVAEIESSKRLAESVRNEKLGVNAAEAKIELGTLRNAKVRDLNEALRLVVLNIGAAQGVRIGMPFVIRHGDQPIALARAVDVRERMTGAMVERVEKNTKPQLGDIASVAVE